VSRLRATGSKPFGAEGLKEAIGGVPKKTRKLQHPYSPVTALVIPATLSSDDLDKGLKN